MRHRLPAAAGLLILSAIAWGAPPVGIEELERKAAILQPAPGEAAWRQIP